MGLGFVFVHRRKAFTLIELLVVITIIMVLSSILLPAMNKARGKARQSTCLNNCKQIGIATRFYVDESDDYLFPARPPAPYDHWLNYLFVENLNGDERILQCPSLAKDEMFNPYGGDGPYANLGKASYLMNIIREQGVNGWSHLGAYISTSYDESFGWTGGDAADPMSVTRVIDPSSKIFVTDSAPGLTNSSTGIGILRLHETEHGLVDPNQNGEVNAAERQVGWQHNGSYSALFGDGHVEARRRSEHEEWNVYQFK